MSDSLLAHIASNFISQYENVANSSICYLLNKYEAARQALKKLLEVDAVPSRYTTEESTQSSGRPDVTGRDVEGNKTVIIEGKFWANLTENQPNGYLLELPADCGRLLFLAPAARIKSLTLDLEKRLGGEDARMLVRSWDELLEQMERENDKNHDAGLASDLRQLKDLCQKMDVEGMAPLSASDLDPMNGRISAQLADVIDECYPLVRQWEKASFEALRKTATKNDYGFYFCFADFFGCFLYFSSHNWYQKDNHTPIWLRVREARKIGKDGKFYDCEKINHALHAFDPVNADDNEIGIMLKPGMDKNQVIEHIVGTVKEVLEHLDRVVVR